ncbi:hypothetical protein CRUP_012077 [Coryphaenoides rupestris]|nr:hypothetical protein CRUP_012077 [Coryphaenoides rupestris]
MESSQGLERWSPHKVWRDRVLKVSGESHHRVSRESSQGLDEVTTCNVNTDHIFYTIYSTFGAFYIPTLLLIALYGRIYVEARKRILKQAPSKPGSAGSGGVGKRLTSAHLITDSPGSVASSNATSLNYGTSDTCDAVASAPASADVSQARSQVSSQVSQVVVKVTVSDALLEKKRISAAREKKATKTLGIILGAYIVCWLPFFIYTLLVSVCASCFHPELFDIFTWLGYLNSLINPIIYTMANEDFKRAFHKLIRFRTAAPPPGTLRTLQTQRPTRLKHKLV